MSLDLIALRSAAEAHGKVVRVVVADVKGSAPREAGAAMLVWADGQSGTIGGGALEFEAARAARAMLADASPDRVSRHPLGPALAQCCGGSVTLVTEAFDTTRLAELPRDAPFARRVEGSGALPLGLTRALRRNRAEGSDCPTLFEDNCLIEPIAQATRQLWIFGAGHVGRALVAVLSPLPEIAITWIDTAPDRFPDPLPDGVTVIPTGKPAELLRHAPPQAEHLIVTYSHALDLELCHAVLNHGFAGAGLIGSATKWARFRTRLRQLGHTDAQIDRIQCPIGNPMLGKAPQAIAIGVAAALLSGNSHNRAATQDGTG